MSLYCVNKAERDNGNTRLPLPRRPPATAKYHSTATRPSSVQKTRATYFFVAGGDRWGGIRVLVQSLSNSRTKAESWMDERADSADGQTAHLGQRRLSGCQWPSKCCQSVFAMWADLQGRLRGFLWRASQPRFPAGPKISRSGRLHRDAIG